MRSRARLWSWALVLIVLGLLASGFVSSAAAAPEVSTPLYFRTSDDTQTGTPVLSTTQGPLMCTSSKPLACLHSIFTPYASRCINPFVNCNYGTPIDFITPPLTNAITIKKVGVTVFLYNNALVTLSFKVMFNLTATVVPAVGPPSTTVIYTTTSPSLTQSGDTATTYSIPNPPGNSLAPAAALKPGNMIDCAVTVFGVQDQAGNPRSSDNIELVYDGKGAAIKPFGNSSCTITSDVCPTFKADQPVCPTSSPIPEFGAPAALLAAVGMVLVLVVRRLSSRRTQPARPYVRSARYAKSPECLVFG